MGDICVEEIIDDPESLGGPEVFVKSLSLNPAHIQPWKISSGYWDIRYTREIYRQNGDVICCGLICCNSTTSYPAVRPPWLHCIL